MGKLVCWMNSANEEEVSEVWSLKLWGEMKKRLDGEELKSEWMVCNSWLAYCLRLKSSSAKDWTWLADVICPLAKWCWKRKAMSVTAWMTAWRICEMFWFLMRSRWLRRVTCLNLERVIWLETKALRACRLMSTRSTRNKGKSWCRKCGMDEMDLKMAPKIVMESANENATRLCLIWRCKSWRKWWSISRPQSTSLGSRGIPPEWFSRIHCK